MNKKTLIFTGIALAGLILIAVIGMMYNQNLNSESENSASNNTSSNSSTEGNNQSGNSATSPNSNNPSNNSDTPSNTPQETFDSARLSQFNGRGGNKCYVAVDGIVYDMTGSSDWRNGVHTPSNGRAVCGQNESDVIGQSPHGKSVLSRVPTIGTYLGQ